MKRIIGLAILLIALTAAPASAKLPKYKYGKPSIVPGKSIGGVAVGQTKAKAKAVWGAPDRCFAIGGTTTCNYTSPSPASYGVVFVAAFYLKRGRVVAVETSAPEQAKALAKVKKLKTAKGIHIGSRTSAARKKYNIPITGAGEANLSHADFKQGGRCTSFYAPTFPYKVINSITVGICRSVISLYF